MAAAYDINDVSEFELQRKKAAEQSAANLQTRKDALTRRFAALGNLDSGVRIKQEQLAADDESRNLNAANEAINAQQNAELRRRAELRQGQEFAAGEAEKGRLFASSEALKGREFARGERVGGQDFASQQAALQRLFASGEREAGQKFAGDQAGLQREFARGERLGSQEFAKGEREAGQQFAVSEADKNREIQKQQFQQQFDQSVKQFKESVAQFDLTFALEKEVTAKNLEFAQQVLEEPDLFEKLMGFSGLPSANSAKGLIDNITGAGSAGGADLGQYLGDYLQSRVPGLSLGRRR